ncbi:MAG: repair protein RecN [Peptococcaceae bacterium]|nr:repair protein RecN [Peptococcaceae bacterium]
MLQSILIKNFALIEEVQIDYAPDFNVLTGETGAGKSIIIDAVTILLGGRAQTEMVRTGAEKCLIEGIFSLPPHHPAYGILSELGIEAEEDYLVLSREISLNGKNTCRVNGRIVTLGNYRLIGTGLIDIHGQHDHQSLLQPEKHLFILDNLGGAEHLQLVKDVREKYETWLSLKKELFYLREKEHERLQKIDFLTYQINEIKEARLKPGEDTELAREANLLANAEKIANYVNLAYNQLFSGERGQSAYDLLSKALNNLQEINRLDPVLENLLNQLEPCLYVIEEVAGELRNYRENIEFSPARLEQVEKRLQYLKDLTKKYGPSLEDVIAYAEKAERELKTWMESEERALELEGSVTSAWKTYECAALELSTARKKLALELEEKVIRELKELAMPHANFSVTFLPGEPAPLGMEKIEFYISPNPGEPLLPVAKIASGGELSRIMLALKTITADLDDVGTLIFDEIDSGIGGKAAQKVAEKLEKISKSQQVICVTHSPLIAALADHHLFLEKKVEGGRTRTTVKILGELERVDEISRMLGGDKQTADLRKHASQILKKR